MNFQVARHDQKIEQSCMTVSTVRPTGILLLMLDMYPLTPPPAPVEPGIWETYKIRGEALGKARNNFGPRTEQGMFANHALYSYIAV